MQYVEAAHPFVTRQRVADGVVANVPDVQRAARIRQHFKHIELGVARILFGLKERRVGPSLAPLQFDLVMVVLLFRHSFSGSWGCSEARPFKYNCVGWRPPTESRIGRQGLAHDSIVISVASHPKPQDASRDGHAYRTMMQSNARGTESAHFLKMQRRMLGVNFKQREGLVG